MISKKRSNHNESNEPSTPGSMTTKSKINIEVMKNIDRLGEYSNLRVSPN